MTVDAQNFSPARLRALFTASLEKGYRPVFFGEEDRTEGPYILWRHDIDLEIAAAVAMAEIEAECGIRSTYFFMTRSWFYNLLNAEAIAGLKRIKALGHALGLHCDLQLDREAEADEAHVTARVEEDFRLLEVVYPGMFDRVVSFHNPPKSVINRQFESFYSTYQPKFFGTVKYLSDSNRRWREGPPENWLDPATTPRLSVLLHPVIWAYPGQTMPEGMQRYMADRTDACRAMLIADDVWVEAQPQA